MLKMTKVYHRVLSDYGIYYFLFSFESSISLYWKKYKSINHISRYQTFRRVLWNTNSIKLIINIQQCVIICKKIKEQLKNYIYQIIQRNLILLENSYMKLIGRFIFSSLYSISLFFWVRFWTKYLILLRMSK